MTLSHPGRYCVHVLPSKATLSSPLLQVHILSTVGPADQVPFPRTQYYGTVASGAGSGQLPPYYGTSWIQARARSTGRSHEKGREGVRVHRYHFAIPSSSSTGLPCHAKGMAVSANEIISPWSQFSLLFLPLTSPFICFSLIAPTA